MHSTLYAFLHGIRRPFLRPVWAPFRRCLPLLALLNCCPEDGDLLPLTNLNQLFGYGDLLQNGDENYSGDLLPTNGEEDDSGNLLQSGEEDQDGDLLPSGEVNQEGDLLPNSGVDDDGVLLSRCGDEANQRNLQPHLHDGQHQAEGALLPTNGDDDDTNNEALQPPPQRLDKGFLLPKQSEDGDDHHALILDLCSSLKDGQHEDANGCPPPFIGADDQQNKSNSVQALNAWVLPSPRPRVKMKDELSLYNVHAWEHDAWASPPSPSTASLLLILFTAQLHDKLPDPTMHFTLLRVRKRYQVRERHSEESAATHFLIPLRGSVSMQWNDEEFVEDVAAQKMKTKRRMMVLRPFYLMKDLLDPG